MGAKTFRGVWRPLCSLKANFHLDLAEFYLDVKTVLSRYPASWYRGRKLPWRDVLAVIWRIFFTLAAINFIVLAIFVFLVTIQFEAVLSGSIRERLEVVVENVRDPFSSVTEMGLPLSALRNADAMLHRVKQDDDAIEAIHVYGASGQILHSTGESGNQSVQPTVLAAGSGQDGNDIWHLEDKKHFLVGGTITDGSGQAVGGVAIAYSKENAITQVRAMSARLAFYCVLGLLVALLLSLPVLQFALRRHVGLFDALLQSYDRLERRFWRAPGGAETPIAPIRALGVDTGEFSSLLDRSEQNYAAEKQRLANIGGGTHERG